jgi:hypothetical protein
VGCCASTCAGRRGIFGNIAVQPVLSESPASDSCCERNQSKIDDRQQPDEQRGFEEKLLREHDDQIVVVRIEQPQIVRKTQEVELRE